MYMYMYMYIYIYIYIYTYIYIYIYIYIVDEWRQASSATRVLFFSSRGGGWTSGGVRDSFPEMR